MRRSRRNGQLRRVSSWSRGSHLAIKTSSVCSPARAMIRPNGSARNEPPQNSRPPPAGPSWPTRLTAATYTPLAIAWDALHGLPGAGLGRAKLCFLGGVPADRRGIEQDLGALEGRQPGGFGIPLVPADEGADAGKRRVERLKTKVAGSEVILLVVERVVGNVHLAITAAEACRRSR